MLCRMSLERASSETAISPRAQLLASRLEARHARDLAHVDAETQVKSLAKVGATSTTTTTNLRGRGELSPAVAGALAAAAAVFLVGSAMFLLPRSLFEEGRR